MCRAQALAVQWSDIRRFTAKVLMASPSVLRDQPPRHNSAHDMLDQLLRRLKRRLALCAARTVEVNSSGNCQTCQAIMRASRRNLPLKYVAMLTGLGHNHLFGSLHVPVSC
jgi:hypothetical protein